MTSDVVSLYKILSDDTNQKILRIIYENVSLSYTDLVEKTELYSEALFNYHLKVLGELLRKNEEDKYILTEKGQSTLKLLSESSEQNQKVWKKKQKQNGVYVGLGYAVIIIFALIFYSQGYIERKILYRIILYTSFPVMLYISYIFNVASLTSESVRKKRIVYAKLSFAFLGGIIGMAIAMIGLAVASVISVSKGGPNFWHITDSYVAFNDVYFISSFAIGCIIGYYVGKKIAERPFLVG
jgi:DNA-binding transcriptional ArsR family regulator